METMEINGETWVKKSAIPAADSLARRGDMEYCIIRTKHAGVHAGYVAYRDGQEVTLIDSRRIWYWAGAASLSQLAVEGTKSPGECKFPCVVPKIVLPEAIEIIPTTDSARASIEAVSIWQA